MWWPVNELQVASSQLLWADWLIDAVRRRGRRWLKR
jgi:hypothetical protein